jgi:hypothetical protein
LSWEAELPVDANGVLAEGRAAAARPLMADLREQTLIIGRLRGLAANPAALPADRQEAEAVAENLARRVLESVRGEYAARRVLSGWR